jgi:hypothetical protein
MNSNLDLVTKCNPGIMLVMDVDAPQKQNEAKVP